MNDRFRFRVWSVREKEMIYNAEIAYDGTNYPTEWQMGENNNDGWICCFGEYINRKEDYKVMQCTGLKDKNGRLIYEGDIIQHDTAAGPKCWPVVFKNGCFVLPYESGNAWLGKVIEHCPYDSGVVVVGNIHENPALLEDK